MKNTTTVGLIIAVIMFFGITAFVFSQIQIDAVFADSVTGNNALIQSGITQVNLLSWITDGISDAIDSTIRSIFSWSWFNG